MSCSCCAQCQAELRDAQMELGRALVERDHAILARDHVKELLADAKLDLANMTKGTRTEDLEPGEDWAAKHCEPAPVPEASLENLRSADEQLRGMSPAPDTSERDFRRALVVALVPAYPINVVKLLDKADEIAVEYLLRENARERGGKGSEK